MKAIMPWRVLYVLIVMLMISSCCSYFFLTVIMGSTVFIIIIKLSLLCMFIYLQTLKRWRDILSFKMWADELGVTRTDLVLLIFYSPLNDIYTWLAKKFSLLSPSVCKWSTRLLKRWLVSSIPTETFSWTLSCMTMRHRHFVSHRRCRHKTELLSHLRKAPTASV